MTRQEVIAILKAEDISGYSYNDVTTARDMAIDALKKLDEIEDILTDNDFDIPFDGDSIRLTAIGDVLGIEVD